MASIFGKLFYPFVLLIGVWCSHESGVTVRYETGGQPVEKRLNVVCEDPDVRIPVFRSGK